MVYSSRCTRGENRAPHVGRFVGKQLAKRAVKQPLKYKNTKAVAGKITGYTKHGINQAISRDGVGVSSKAILNAVKTGKKLYKVVVELNILVNKL